MYSSCQSAITCLRNIYIYSICYMTTWSYTERLEEHLIPQYIDENTVTGLVKRGVVTDTFRRLKPEKKARIYAVAIDLFGRYGYDGLPVDRFCRDAGISKGSFFQYFPSKSHLLEMALLLFDQFMSDWIIELSASEGSALLKERLSHLFRAMTSESSWPKSERLFYQFADRGLAHSAVVVRGMDIGHHVTEYISGIINRSVETGEIRSDLEPEIISTFVAASIGRLVADFHRSTPENTIDIDRFLDTLLYDGIKP